MLNLSNDQFPMQVSDRRLAHEVGGRRVEVEQNFFSCFFSMPGEQHVILVHAVQHNVRMLQPQDCTLQNILKASKYTRTVEVRLTPAMWAKVGSQSVTCSKPL